MEIRYQPGQPLRVNVLATSELLSGHIEKIVGRLAIINLDQPVAFGAPLRIDFDDSMILGEVSACEATESGHRVTVDVRDAIPVMSDLARLVSALMTDGRGARTEERSNSRTAKA
ncbi:MAG TPA: hypothetical protein VER03_07805 [Bryobacteraceae bacterium]|nr:hypothetical protein [Bryobacteraceae bacterium]